MRKKFVIMRRAECPKMPIVEADNNRLVKQMQSCGYNIVGRISAAEEFVPKFAVTHSGIVMQEERKEESYGKVSV